MIHVAVGLLFNSAGQILIAQRLQGKYCGGLWEFPGGKVEAQESPFEALKRELFEELAIQVISAEPWMQFQHNYTDRLVLLDIWRVTEFTGEPRGAEGQLIRWTYPDEFNQFQFPEGNKLIIEKICAGKI